MKSKTTPTKLDRYQRRYLQDQLRFHRYDHSFAEPKEPAAVKQARRIVSGWDRHVSVLRQSHERARARKHAEAVKQLNFGTPDQALAAVEAYRGAP